MNDTMTRPVPDCPNGHGALRLVGQSNMFMCDVCGWKQHKDAYGGHSITDYASTWRERHALTGYHFDLDAMPDPAPDDPAVVAKAVQMQQAKRASGRYESWGEIMDVISMQALGLMRYGVMPERIELNGHNLGVLERASQPVAPKDEDGRPMSLGHISVDGTDLVLPLTLASDPHSLKIGVEVVGRLVEAHVPRQILQLKAMRNSPRQIPCPVCQGSGLDMENPKQSSDIPCGFCEGLGRVAEGEYAEIELNLLREQETGSGS